MINKTPIYRWQLATVMAIWHIILMASSHDLSCGERRSHQMLDSKTGPLTTCHTSQPSVQQLSTVHSYLTDSCQAVLSDDTRNMHFQKSAYFPGEKITRTQMLNRVSAKSFTWLMNQSCKGVSWHLKERSHSSHTCMSTAVTPVQHSSWQLSWSHLSEGPEICTFKKVHISRARK